MYRIVRHVLHQKRAPSTASQTRWPDPKQLLIIVCCYELRREVEYCRLPSFFLLTSLDHLQQMLGREAHEKGVIRSSNRAEWVQGGGRRGEEGGGGRRADRPKVGAIVR